VPDRHRETVSPYRDLADFQRLLTDASVHDDERVGQGYDALKERGYFWVAVRVAAGFRRLPDGRPLQIETWATPPAAASIDRMYRLSDGSGTFAEGVARWALVRLADGRPVRLAETPGLLEPRRFETEDAYPAGFGTLDFDLEEPDRPIMVPASGIDRNGHLNNARYWDLVFSAAAAAGLPTEPVARLEIAYRNALFAGETALVRLRREGDGIAFCAHVVRSGIAVRAFAGRYAPRP